MRFLQVELWKHLQPSGEAQCPEMSGLYLEVKRSAYPFHQEKLQADLPDSNETIRVEPVIRSEIPRWNSLPEPQVHIFPASQTRRRNVD